tara:strand:+ start:71787 stop:71984 length:198 start_codon:yes stop_codon:yes gene_type:complete
MLSTHFFCLELSGEDTYPTDTATPAPATHRNQFQQRNTDLKGLHSLKEVLLFTAVKATPFITKTD